MMQTLNTMRCVCDGDGDGDGDRDDEGYFDGFWTKVMLETTR
jgi:hypothetical protein